MTDKIRDVYMAIMHAAANGRGLHLTADEVCDLALDDAIETRAGNALNETEHAGMTYKRVEFWRTKKPYPVGQFANLSGMSLNDPKRIPPPSKPPEATTAPKPFTFADPNAQREHERIRAESKGREE
ncbi:hypothetical protein [Rhizobium leguminosarum]